jgi:hypothetical protein
VRWVDPTDADLAAVRCYMTGAGAAMRQTAKGIQVAVFENLPAGTYHFACSSVDLAGNESARTAPVTKAIP